MVRCTLLICLLCAGYVMKAQPMQRISRLTLQVGAGPNYFLNNFREFRSRVNEINYNFSLRAVWEPGHRVSIGLKTGYYKIYTVSLNNAKANADFELRAIPVQIWVQTKISKNFYAFYGMGPSLFFNTMSSNLGETIDATFTSFADMSTGFGYRKLLTKKLQLGCELEYFHSSKSAENIATVQVVAGWRL